MAVRSAGAGRRAAFEARLRPMGPRGEGWIGLQMVVQIGALVIASLTGPVVGGPARVVLAVLGIALMAVGVLLFAWGGAHLGHSFSIWVDPRPDGALVTSGPYRWARHPICTAQVVLVAGWALTAASLVGLLLVPVVALYLDRLKLAREEQTLLAKYPGYRDYMRVVPHRMLPSPPRRETASQSGS
jgi:protein-S-isoprenylcysteine O-methyltransferase Ste14